MKSKKGNGRANHPATNIGDTKMKKEKDMMNPCNWRTEDVKDAVQAAMLAASGIILAYAAIWLAY